MSAAVQRVESPVAYHRLYRGVPNYRWWRPLVAIVLFVAFVLVASTILAIITLVVGVAVGELRIDTVDHLLADVNQLAVLDAASPFSLFLGLGSVAVVLPLVPLSLLCAGLRPVGMVSSVAFRIRWRWLATCLVPGFVVLAVSTALSLGVLPLILGESFSPVPVDPTPFIISMVIVLLLVPIQATAEEYVFRGVLIQAIGSWVKPVPIAIAISTILFAVSHAYDIWGQLDVAVFGLTAAILAWRTGGLESGIVLHTLNNIIAFVVLGSGITGGTVNAADGSSPLSIGITILTMGAFAFWVDRLATRRGLERRRELAPPPQPLPYTSEAAAGPIPG